MASEGALLERTDAGMGKPNDDEAEGGSEPAVPGETAVAQRPLNDNDFAIAPTRLLRDSA